MNIIVGLGNPEPKYDKTRHNVGHLVLDLLMEQNKNQWSKGKGPFQINKTPLQNGEVVLAKPTVYMNDSGTSVKALLEHFHVSPEHCLVVLDDVNLPLGKLRFRPKGSAGGHHGLESIIASIQTDNFSRLRVGVAVGDLSGQDLTGFVLEKFSKAEFTQVSSQVKRAAQACLDWTTIDSESLMQRYNS